MIYFQNDNGKDFNNQILKIYQDNNNIKYLRSAPYYPQTNRCCEAVYKGIKNYLLDLKENQKDFFYLDIAIEEAINFLNNIILKNNGFKLADLKDIDDENNK